MRRPVFFRFILFMLSVALSVTAAQAFQSSSGTISGTVTDPSGAIVPNANVEITNHVSGYTRTFKTDSTGQFHFYNVPFNPYHLTVTVSGFADLNKLIEVDTSVPLTLPLQLSLAGSST